MKKLLVTILAMLILTGCGSNTVAEVTVPTTSVAAEAVQFSGVMAQAASSGSDFSSQFDTQTHILLSDETITVDGNEEAVFLSNDITYYEDRDTYDSGNPYGEGSDDDKHTAQEAAAHTVVNITQPGTYRVSGKLSAGQLRVDLGSNAYYDPEAVVELILDNAEITCTLAPAILFLNTYECDGNWSVDTAKPEVDTASAGANLILNGENKVSGSYVAKVYKDADGEKKLWKQDGAIYSYMSLNIFGPGSLYLTAENEGLDTELHLTIYGGDITIRAQNDGINTNEDGVSVTTIQGGSLHIIAGMGEEGDGIDSNGYLVINGGTVVAAANPVADAGLDSDLGSYVNGGIVIALGSTMDWVESDSQQVAINLQFRDFQSSGSAIVVTKEDGTVVFAYDPSEDETLVENIRRYQGAILSCPGFTVGDSYQVWLDGSVTGEEVSGVYRSVSAYENGIQMGCGGNDMGMVGGRPGGMGQRPQGEWSEDRERPEDARVDPPNDEVSAMPGDMKPGQRPENFTLPEGEAMPADFDPAQMGGGRGQRPEDMKEMTPSEGFDSEMSAMPGGEFGGRSAVEYTTDFYMRDMVNTFSGVSAIS